MTKQEKLTRPTLDEIDICDRTVGFTLEATVLCADMVEALAVAAEIEELIRKWRVASG